MLTEGHQSSAIEAPLAPKDDARDLRVRIQAAVETARAHATLVDAEGRFPREAFAKIRELRLLGLMIPVAFGGEGVGLSTVVDICYALGQACSSTALIYAMHQVKVACVARHSRGSKTIERILWRLAAEQLLLASSTTEGNAGGDVRSSEAAVERIGDEVRLDRAATVISYALDADGLVTTARRSVDVAANDQVLLVLLKPDYVIQRLHGWDALGMRGTQSEGFRLHVKADAGQILPDRYDTIHEQTMVPFSHLLWGAVWAGIAAAAAGTAKSYCRNVARRSKGQLPPGVAQITHADAHLNSLVALLAHATRRYETIMMDESAVAAFDFQSTITLLKVQASEFAVSSVMSSMRACGLSGYRNDAEFSIGRYLRDILSAPIMINNERILANLSASALLKPLPTHISG